MRLAILMVLFATLISAEVCAQAQQAAPTTIRPEKIIIDTDIGDDIDDALALGLIIASPDRKSVV